MAPPTRTFITSEDVKRLLRDDQQIIDAPHKRRTWQNSRLVANPDGTSIPLLRVIAERVFGPWDPSTHYPVWKDMDYTNESFENVMLVPRFADRPKRPKNESGFPANTPGYHKWYRAQNPDKVKQWARTAYKKQSALKKVSAAQEKEIAELKARLDALGLGTPTFSESDIDAAIQQERDRQAHEQQERDRADQAWRDQLRTEYEGDVQ